MTVSVLLSINTNQPDDPVVFGRLHDPPRGLVTAVHARAWVTGTTYTIHTEASASFYSGEPHAVEEALLADSIAIIRSVFPGASVEAHAVVLDGCDWYDWVDSPEPARSNTEKDGTPVRPVVRFGMPFGGDCGTG
jgi:hypothetical protein